MNNFIAYKGAAYIWGLTVIVVVECDKNIFDHGAQNRYMGKSSFTPVTQVIPA